MARVGAALGHDHNNRGFHTTGIAGPVASAVAAGIVMGLPVETMLSAVGTACSSASGIKAFTQGTGGMVKRMHAGRAAESGMLACDLARRGFKFVGSTVMYAHMQAVGMVNDHLVSCFRHGACGPP